MEEHVSTCLSSYHQVFQIVPSLRYVRSRSVLSHAPIILHFQSDEHTSHPSYLFPIHANCIHAASKQSYPPRSPTVRKCADRPSAQMGRLGAARSPAQAHGREQRACAEPQEGNGRAAQSIDQTDRRLRQEAAFRIRSCQLCSWQRRADLCSSSEGCQTCERV